MFTEHIIFLQNNSKSSMKIIFQKGGEKIPDYNVTYVNTLLSTNLKKLYSLKLESGQLKK